MLFTLGAVAAYLLLLAFSDFTFVWGSTFGISDTAVDTLSQVVAAPWAGWLPAAVPSTQLIADSRFHPAISNLAMADLVALRAWWPLAALAAPDNVQPISATDSASPRHSGKQRNCCANFTKALSCSSPLSGKTPHIHRPKRRLLFYLHVENAAGGCHFEVSPFHKARQKDDLC